MRGLGLGHAPVNTTHRLTLAAVLMAAGTGGCRQVDDRPAEWGYLSPALFQPNCATTSCHTPAAAVSGLDFSTPENGYESLTGLVVSVIYPPDGGFVPNPPPGATLLNSCGVEQATEVCWKARPLVTPYDPAGSRVVNMLRARDAPRMPPDRPLPEADIELVERWILNGAFEYANHAQPDASSADAIRTDAAADRTASSDASRDQGSD